MNYQLNKSMRIISQLPAQALADQQKSPTKTVSKENLLNRCLNHIERIKRIKAIDEEIKEGILEEAWKVYAFLQNFQPLVGENLNPSGSNREISLDALPENSLVEASGPDIYAGGLGYRHVNWDAEYLMAVTGSERHHNPYWNPKEAYPKPVKHFTKEEIEALNCPSG